MGFLSDMGETIKSRLNWKTALSEVADTLATRVIPQGAAEIAHALFTQASGYVPYGQGQKPSPVETADASAPAQEPDAASQAAEPVLTPEEQYHANLALYGAHSSPSKDQHPSL